MALTAAESERAGGPLAALSGAAGETDLLVVRDDPAPVRRPLTPAQARELLAAEDDLDDDTQDGTGDGTEVFSVAGWQVVATRRGW
ncbi:hypothetical protein [Pseudonocardia sp. Ae505_Ps2]|uniref:hypothetical protein n=1 Tax=Pseudonocardia sp. Ae505_Ps2 TaxID=1885034 RepID=UPI000960413B|nr:hypothetical protein [Pseudonocardia sp. Ae505_Ps2]OLM12673.1 hypothetical protein Ae505Ps2_2801 [Pseudonocardia sp. Ae505_Ps2]